jgi:hypothetical protein
MPHCALPYSYSRDEDDHGRSYPTNNSGTAPSRQAFGSLAISEVHLLDDNSSLPISTVLHTTNFGITSTCQIDPFYGCTSVDCILFDAIERVTSFLLT